MPKMKAKIKRLISSFPNSDYEEALILLSQEDYVGIRKIAIRVYKRMESLIDALGEVLMDEEEEIYEDE